MQAETAPVTVLGAVEGAVAPLRAARKAVWRAEPAEVRALLERRGIMLPGRPLLLSESEARKLQEQLWLLRMRDAADDPAFAARAARRLVEGARSRFEGRCGLHEAGAVLGLASKALVDHPGAAPALLEALALYAGRLAAWLDRRIPWHGLNEAVFEARKVWR